jgi:hypothetical protein
LLWTHEQGLEESKKKIDKKLWLCDLDKIDLSPEKEMGSKISPPVDVEFFEGDSATMKFPGKVDLLFIDTFHVYGHLKREFEFHHANVTTYMVFERSVLSIMDISMCILILKHYAFSWTICNGLLLSRSY